ncbi:hypothetical protein BDQ94DRAFT_165136 [Aspergillus welwitschiae]|uniref:Uncharacterized protein n=1 Tax=Aspergillus welwitschiae TaxID=1341132 RepID=A0A3F3QKN5_9EURO|nr:hypothetical protein BDQ94DRAFT_165136 [Aspergillus welwitschiae]RDH39422.1 hypothetical protein BDQ94DRAFT_165136 [Aspergillus welwitschiae]
MPAEVHTHPVSTPHAAGREQNSKAEARSNSQCTVGVSAVSMRTHERGHLACVTQQAPVGSEVSKNIDGKHPQQKSKDTLLRPLLSDMIPHDRYGEVTNTTKIKNPCQHRARQKRPRHVYAFFYPDLPYSTLPTLRSHQLPPHMQKEHSQPHSAILI